MNFVGISLLVKFWNHTLPHHSCRNPLSLYTKISPGSRYIVEIVVYAENRSGLLTDISKKFSDENIDIISLSTNTDSKGRVTMRISFETASRSDMDRLCDKVRSVQNVTDVRRPE